MLDDSDLVFASGEDCPVSGFRYDAFTFDHPGGPLTLGVRGAGSGGGTLPDSSVWLFAGAGVPPGDPCAQSLERATAGGCPGDPYEEAERPAGIYTAAVFEDDNIPGTYVFELNRPNPCP